MKITKSQLGRFIKEELEVTLTNEEASDFFDIDSKEFLGEFIEEAMGAGSRKSRLYPDATKEERRAERRRNRRAGQRDARRAAVEEPLDTDIPEPDESEEYNISALVADSEEAEELPADELVEFSLGSLGKLAGGALKLFSSENFRRTAVQLFLRMAEKELSEHIRQSADNIAQKVVPDIPFDGDILESLMQRTFSRILADQSDELSKSIIDIITNGFVERLMGDPNIREHLAEAMGRVSKTTKTPPDATKDEKKAANKRVRKAGKKDSKKELDEAIDPVDAVEDSIEAMPEDEQQKLLDTLMNKLESGNLEESKKNPVIAALTKLPGGRDLAAVYYASLDRDTPTKLRIIAAIAIINLIAPGDIGTLMGLDFLGPLAGLDDYLLIRRMMKKYKKAGLPAEKHHDQVQAAAGETLSPERSAEKEIEKTRDLGKTRTGAAIAKARIKTLEEGKLVDLKSIFDRFLIKN